MHSPSEASAQSSIVLCWSVPGTTCVTTLRTSSTDGSGQCGFAIRHNCRMLFAIWQVCSFYIIKNSHYCTFNSTNSIFCCPNICPFHHSCWNLIAIITLLRSRIWASDVDQLVECSSKTHKALLQFTAPNESRMVIHRVSPALRRWRHGNQQFKLSLATHWVSDQSCVLVTFLLLWWNSMTKESNL